MGFRFQRRINLSGGWGLNAGKSGGSLSYRTGGGSVGTKGFSIRTGIPGLSFRQNWGKGSGAVGLAVVFVMAAVAAVVVVTRVIIFVAPIVWQGLTWLALTLYDLVAYVVQRYKDWRSQASA